MIFMLYLHWGDMLHTPPNVGLASPSPSVGLLR